MKKQLPKLFLDFYNICAIQYPAIDSRLKKNLLKNARLFGRKFLFRLESLYQRYFENHRKPIQSFYLLLKHNIIDPLAELDL